MSGGFTLEQLRGFVAVAEELHFGRAATRLRMTQPPLSRQVQKLEQFVGARLLERNNRGVALTTAGSAFLTEARRLLAAAEAAPDLARRVAAGSAGVVRIGFTAGSTFGILGEVLNLVTERLPDVAVGLREMVTRDQVAALVSGEIDLGLARPPFDTQTFRSRLLHREALLAALPSGHPLTGLGRPLRAADLVGEPVIMHSPTEARYFYDLVVGLLPTVHTRVVHTVSQIVTMVWLVAAGRGIAFVPASAAGLGVPGVVFAPLGTAVREPVELHLLWMREAANPPLHSVLRVLEQPA